MFDPKVTIYPYPEITDRHYLVVKKNDGTVFDKNYNYVDNTKKYKCMRFIFRILTATVAFPVCAIRQGLIIKGRKNLRAHRPELKNGAVTVSNHVHMWDFISVMCALFPFAPRVISWANNMRGENAMMIRYAAGGIPVPEDDIRATGAFVSAVISHLTGGGMIHVCAEGSMWEYYAPIRPFKQGAFYFAVKANKPVLPLAFSYREPKGLDKLLHPKGMFTLNIGEPIYPDPSLERDDAIEKLTREAHRAMCTLAGIDPDENIYPPIFDNTHRVDYYSNVYGIGKKYRNAKANN